MCEYEARRFVGLTAGRRRVCPRAMTDETPERLQGSGRGELAPHAWGATDAAVSPTNKKARHQNDHHRRTLVGARARHQLPFPTPRVTPARGNPEGGVRPDRCLLEPCEPGPRPRTHSFTALNHPP